MNKYQEIKRILKNIEVAERYLGRPEKYNSTGNWYKSPFRSEKTASFCVSEKGIHDFGDSSHYDIISFIAKYFNTTAYEALKILCNDFNIGSLENEYETNEIINRVKQKREEEKIIKHKIKTWYINTLQRICDEIKTNEKLLKIYENKSNFNVLKILYDEQAKLEYSFEILTQADEETKEKIYLMEH